MIGILLKLARSLIEMQCRNAMSKCDRLASKAELAIALLYDQCGTSAPHLTVPVRAIFQNSR